jgi:hypothetical protein
MIANISRTVRRSREYVNKIQARRWLTRQFPKHSVGVEIGVHLGNFTQTLLDSVRPRKLHLIDPWRYFSEDTYQSSFYGGTKIGGQIEMDRRFDSVKQRFSKEMQQEIVVIHRDTSDQVASQFPDAYFDWIYIDGNHLFEFVKNDLEMYAPKVVDNGLIAGDDYGIAGWWEDGVTRAVDEFVAAGHADVIGMRHGQFILRKRANPTTDSPDPRPM